MLSPILYTLISVFVISAISLIGIFTLAINQKRLNKLIILFVSFAAGSLFGAVFFDLLPESVKLIGDRAYLFVLVGIVIFFVLETFFFWYHNHEQCTKKGSHAHCSHRRKIKPVGYLNVIGDGLHNLIDGMVLATAYLISIELGLVTTFAVLIHEVAQEIGDFGILIHSGFSVNKALLFNFLSALGAFVGVGIVYVLGPTYLPLDYVLPIAAGGFIYIAGSDLLPELHKTKKISKSILQFITFVMGIVVIYLGHLLF